MPDIQTETQRPPQPVAEISYPVREIVSADPGFLVRHGILIIFGILMLAVLGMWFIRYPDVLDGQATLTTQPLPIKLKSQTGGRILRLFADDNTSLPKGSPVAELENNTGYENIRTLDRIADSTGALLRRGDVDGLSAIASSELQSLGEAQGIYNQLLQSITSYVVTEREHIYSRRSDNLRQQSNSYQSLDAVTSKELALTDEELRQANERFKANERLFKEHVISQQEYFEEATRLRQKRLSLEQQRSTRLQNSISIGNADKQLLEMQYERESKESAGIIAIQEAVRNLKNFIQGWKLHFLLTTPYDGSVQYMRPVQVNEVVTAGADLFAVIPSKFHYVAQASMPSTGFGKIRNGQKAHILLDQFPYTEYGYLEGTVSRVSSMPTQASTATGAGMSVYRVEVALPDSLSTSYHQKIPFSPEMVGQVKIITRDRNLLQRFASKFARG